MVRSNLDTTIFYPNIRHIYPEDKQKKVFLYEIVSFDLHFLIVVGEIRDSYIEKNILYCPIYLVRPNNKVIQIGVFEFTKSNYEKYIDHDLDYHFEEPLLYEFVNKDFSVNGLAFHNLTDDKQQQILDYKLMVYFCSGKDSEKLEWFKTINIAGEKLTDQELRNAVYSGSWVSDAKRYFSKNGCAAYGLGGDYMNGVAIRQDYFETIIGWISGDNSDDGGDDR